MVIRALPARTAEVVRLYADMSNAMDDLCAEYTPDQLAVIADFLARVASAGQEATTKPAD